MWKCYIFSRVIINRIRARLSLYACIYIDDKRINPFEKILKNINNHPSSAPYQTKTGIISAHSFFSQQSVSRLFKTIFASREDKYFTPCNTNYSFQLGTGKIIGCDLRRHIKSSTCRDASQRGSCTHTMRQEP